MKILTKEEEDAHYMETLKGGALGGGVGLILGSFGLYAARLRYPVFRGFTVPLQAFLVTSSSTFGAIVTADHFSRGFESSQHADTDFQDASARAEAQRRANQSTFERAMSFGKTHRYQIVGGSWVLSMVAALGIVGRSPYLSTQQKLVQARVYAQGLTIAVLIASAVFEIGDRGKGEGRWETIHVVDESDPEGRRMVEKRVHHERYRGEDQWRDMMEAEEEREKRRKESVREYEKEHGKQHHEHHEGQKKKASKKEEGGEKKEEVGGKKEEGEGKKGE